MLSVKTFVNSPVPSNCYVLYDKSEGGDCIIVDPGSRDEKFLIEFLIQNNLQPKFIILTHEHFDHCWGVNELVKKYNVPIVCSKQCANCIKYEKRNCSVFYDNNESFVINSPAISVEELNYVLPFAGTELRFFASPGHTDASVCLTAGRCIFTGDTLIKDLRTVTKLPTGSMVKLLETKERLLQLKGKEYIVYPGHGDIFDFDQYDIMKMI